MSVDAVPFDCLTVNTTQLLRQAPKSVSIIRWTVQRRPIPLTLLVVSNFFIFVTMSMQFFVGSEEQVKAIGLALAAESVPSTLPCTVGKSMSVALLTLEAKARGHAVKDNWKKADLLNLLEEGSPSHMSAAFKSIAHKKKKTTETTKKETTTDSVNKKRKAIDLTSDDNPKPKSSNKKKETNLSPLKQVTLKSMFSPKKQKIASTAKATTTTTSTTKKQASTAAKAPKATTKKQAAATPKATTTSTKSTGKKQTTATTKAAKTTVPTSKKQTPANAKANTTSTKNKISSQKKGNEAPSKKVKKVDPKDPSRQTSSSTTVSKPKPAPNQKSQKVKNPSAQSSKDVSDYPRISDKMTIAQLKEEIVARKIPSKLPEKKAELLHCLVEGSIRVSQTQAYKDYLSILDKVETEMPALQEASYQKLQARQKKAREQRQKKLEQEQRKKEEGRQQEKDTQRRLHVHSFPRVHCHPLALHNQLKVSDRPRNGQCDCCYYGPPPKYTCETCDWDICEHCFRNKNRTEAEKRRDLLAQQEDEKAAREAREAAWRVNEEREKKARQAKEVAWSKIQEENRRFEEEQERRNRRFEEENRRFEEEQERRWNAKVRFDKKVLEPSSKNLTTSSLLKYTVWCSDQDPYSCPAAKEFDSSWATKEEANQRSEYLFWWKNPWGREPTEICDGYAQDPSVKGGMETWSIHPDGYSEWTVAVVPSSAFPYLDNASI